MIGREKPTLWDLALLLGLAVAAFITWYIAQREAGTPQTPATAPGAEELRFVSMTVDTASMRRGHVAGSPVEVTGHLVLPADLPAPVAAVVLLHGSDGLNAHHFRYAAYLATWGIAAMTVDSFTPRGVDRTVGDQDAVSSYSMLADAYAALRRLAKDPRIDSRRVILMGWSKGGTVADWATRRQYWSLLTIEGLTFAGHVAFYPWCGEQDFEPQLTGAPLLYLLGDADDWSGAEPCTRYAARLAASGYDVEAVVYPNARHGFDYEGRFQSYLPEARRWGDCVYFVRRDGFVIAESGRFERWRALPRYLERCTRAGVHVGTNVTAGDKAMLELRNFLARVLRM